MIPIRDENPTFHTSAVTYLIIIINAAAWIFVQKMGNGELFIQSVFQWGLVPIELLGRVPLGTKVPAGNGLIAVIEEPNYWTVLTHMFMHGGWLHIIGNLWFLAIFGDNIEDIMGSYRFLIFYIICGLAAAGAQTALSPDSALPMVGASGAIGGVMGAYLVCFPRTPVHMLVFFGFFFFRIIVPAYLMLVYWIGIQFLEGFSTLGQTGGGVAFWAHIGGFLCGLILVFPFARRDRLEERRKRRGTIQRIQRIYTEQK